MAENITDQVIAAIDIGTNSAHLVVARMGLHDELLVLDKHKIVLRLGDDLKEAKSFLKQSSIDKTVLAVKQMKEISSSYKPIYRAVATHAIRSAKNGSLLIQGILDATGIQVETIDGLEEARLIALGMQWGLPLGDKSFIGVDIGGGSTEIIVCKGEKIKYVTSVHAGSVVLTKTYLGPKVKKSAVYELEQQVGQRFAPLTKELSNLEYDCAVVSSGMAKTLAMMHAADNSAPMKGFDANGYALKASALARINDRLKSIRQPSKIRDEWSMDVNRSEIILASTVILDHISRLAHVPEWLISTYGLREGLVVDTLNRIRVSQKRRRGHMYDIRWRSMLTLGETFKIDEVQAQRVKDLSLELYSGLLPYIDRIAEEDELRLSDYEILKTAAWLHECGKYISFPRYHKHSAYLIIHASLMGFSQRERLLIALVARYHRKGQASFGSHDCKGLTSMELDRVNLLASILRISVAANRTRKGLLNQISVKVLNGHIILTLKYSKYDGSVEVEYEKVSREKEALEKALQSKIEVLLEADGV